MSHAIVCLSCGAPEDALEIAQSGGPFEEYSDRCTRCGASTFNASTFGYAEDAPARDQPAHQRLGVRLAEHCACLYLRETGALLTPCTAHRKVVL